MRRRRWRDRLRTRFATAAELIAMLWRHRLGWLLPAVFVLLALGTLFALANSFNFAAPFFYALF